MKTDEKEVKEAILREIKKIAEEEFKKSGLGYSFKTSWIGGFIAGYLYRVTEVIKQGIKK
jgi:hypothetical protein